jgi:CBS domain-containing protein
MRARDIMSHETAALDVDATAREVARQLADYQVGGLPVLDSDGRLVGIITRHDLIHREGMSACELMTPGVVCVSEATPVEEVARILTSHDFERVPVLQGARLVGIICRADLARLLAGRWVCQVCGYIQPGRQPLECPTCGAEGRRFEREPDGRPEISRRQ